MMVFVLFQVRNDTKVILHSISMINDDSGCYFRSANHTQENVARLFITKLRSGYHHIFLLRIVELKTSVYELKALYRTDNVQRQLIMNRLIL